MPDIRNVCLIDSTLLVHQAFMATGCNVLRLMTGTEQLFDLEAALAQNDFTPDLVVQFESLGSRAVLTGLDTVDCPTIFWAMDPHLNAHWQAAYARLFDVVCSTQRAWIPKLKEHGAADVRWLPIYGRNEDWRDMAARSHALAFVGRMTDQRPARKWMVEFLREKGREHDLAIEDSLSYEEMMSLYCDSKIIPNESIFGEVNFRLFEGASCGCLVLSQDLGEEQEELFEKGREFDTYANVVELDEKLNLYLGNERLVQAMGKAARERLQTEHMPRHRVERLLEFGRDAALNRATSGEQVKWRVLSMAALWEAGLLPETANDLLARLAGLEQDADVAATVLRIQAAAGLVPLMADNLRTILGGRFYETSSDLNLAGSMAALRADHWDGAKAFWYRHLKAERGRDQRPPANPAELLTLWAKDLKSRGKIVRAGFPFDPQGHLPAAGAECLMVILRDAPEHLPTLRLLDTMLRPMTGLEQARVGYLSILTLHERSDWRLALEIALANLKSYRLDSGLEELQLALDMARGNDQESVFFKALAARDASGLLSGRLAG